MTARTVSSRCDEARIKVPAGATRLASPGEKLHWLSLHRAHFGKLAEHYTERVGEIDIEISALGQIE